MKINRLDRFSLGIPLAVFILILLDLLIPQFFNKELGSKQMHDSIETIGIIFSILLGAAALIMNAIQMKLLVKQAKSSTSALIATRLDELNKTAFEHPEVYEELSKPYEHPEGYEGRAALLLDMTLTLFEQVHIQHADYGLLDEQEYQVWMNVLRHRLRSLFVIGYWAVTKEFYGTSFRDEVERIIESNNKIEEKH